MNWGVRRCRDDDTQRVLYAIVESSDPHIYGLLLQLNRLPANILTTFFPALDRFRTFRRSRLENVLQRLIAAGLITVSHQEGLRRWQLTEAGWQTSGLRPRDVSRAA